MPLWPELASAGLAVGTGDGPGSPLAVGGWLAPADAVGLTPALGDGSSDAPGSSLVPGLPVGPGAVVAATLGAAVAGALVGATVGLAVGLAVGFGVAGAGLTVSVAQLPRVL